MIAVGELEAITGGLGSSKYVYETYKRAAGKQ